MLEEIISIFSEFKDISNIEIGENTVLSSDIGLSSLDYFELINRLEEVFKVKISDKELLRLKTVGDVMECISRKQ